MKNILNYERARSTELSWVINEGGFKTTSAGHYPRERHLLSCPFEGAIEAVL